MNFFVDIVTGHAENLQTAPAELPAYVMEIVSAYWFIDRVVFIVPTGW